MKSSAKSKAATTRRVTTFQAMILKLQNYWVEQGCSLVQPYDLPMGAATFHPATFLRALDSRPWQCVYLQACRRPADGRFGENPNRLQHYYQLQVLFKPPPEDIQQRFLDSLSMLGIDLHHHDIRFIDDNWESPTLGAFGVGWEFWLDGLEVGQFTYFQRIGGKACPVVSCEITYGLERLAMYLQAKRNVLDLVWSQSASQKAVSYGDLFKENEVQQSRYNFSYDDNAALVEQYDKCQKTCEDLIARGKDNYLPAYEQAILASHILNLLDARGRLSAVQRQEYILLTRKMTYQVAAAYLACTGS